MVWLKKIFSFIGLIIILVMPVGIVLLAKKIFEKSRQTINDTLHMNEQVLAILEDKDGRKETYNSNRRDRKWRQKT